jgi:hypothetical protein
MAVWRDRRAALVLALMSRRFPPPWSAEEPDPKLDRQCFIVREGKRWPTSISRRSGDGERRRTRMTTTTLGTANQLPSWGHLLGRAEYLLFKTRFGTVGEPNEVICQSQQDRFCLGVRSARCRDRFGGTVVPIGWIVRKPEGHIRRSPNPPPTPQARSNTIRCQGRK